MRRTRGKLLSVLAASAGLFVGCSFTDIPFVQVGACSSDQSCNDALNPENGFYAECAAFECVDTTDSRGENFKQCRRIEGERQDGMDNDCDFLVDESDSNSSGEPALSLEANEISDGLSGLTSASIASSEALSFIYLQRSGGEASALETTGGESSSLSMMAWDAASDLSADINPNLAPGCFNPSSSEPRSCNINQLVTAAGRNLGFFAQVKTSGCGHGELRVGAIDPSEPSQLIDRGPGFRNPTYRGVATNGTLCSDNGRPACSNAKATYLQLEADGASAAELEETRDVISSECGVSHPAIAARGTQALVAYLGAPLRDDICGGDPVDVFGLLLHERSGMRDGQFFWADASGDGVPDKLGTTISAQSPAIVALDDGGFLLAHTAESGRIRLVFVPGQDDIVGNTGTTCPDDDCESRDGLETDPISDVEELETIFATSAEGVDLQWLDLGSGEAALAISWVEGCADSGTQLPDLQAFVQILRLDTSDGGLSVSWVGPRINLGTTRSFPLAVPSEHDFVVPGFERGDRTAGENDTNGFFLLTRPLGIQAVRIAAFDGQRVTSGENISVVPFPDDPDSTPNSYRYLEAFGPRSPDDFLLTTRGGGSLIRATFSSGD